MPTKFDEKWKNANKDKFYILQYKKLKYDNYWQDIIVRVTKTMMFNDTNIIYIVDYGSQNYPSSKMFKTKSEAIKFAKEYMKKN